MEYLSKLIPVMLMGTTLTLKLFFCTLVLALPLGVVFAVARLSRFKILNVFMQIYIWILPGNPPFCSCNFSLSTLAWA